MAAKTLWHGPSQLLFLLVLAFYGLMDHQVYSGNGKEEEDTCNCKNVQCPRIESCKTGRHSVPTGRCGCCMGCEAGMGEPCGGDGVSCKSGLLCKPHLKIWKGSTPAGFCVSRSTRHCWVTNHDKWHAFLELGSDSTNEEECFTCYCPRFGGTALCSPVFCHYRTCYGEWIKVPGKCCLQCTDSYNPSNPRRNPGV